MKVKPESATVCTCGGNYIYFAGPGEASRVCVRCLNRESGIDLCVNTAQSDDNCDRCECLLAWKYNANGIKLCGDCNRRDEEYRDDMLRDAIGDDSVVALAMCETCESFCKLKEASRERELTHAEAGLLDACEKFPYDSENTDDPPADDIFVAKQVNDYPLENDDVLEQQELEDYENIEYEYFDLSGDLIPF